MSRNRTLYITDAMLKRKGACMGARDQINEVLGTKVRKVPVTVLTALAIERIFHQLDWAAVWLLTPKQNVLYNTERSKRLIDSAEEAASHYTARDRRDAEAFVKAYYSPRT